MVTPLADEIGKRQPFESLEQEAYLNMARTFARMDCEVGRLLKRYNLSPSGYNVLRILRGHARANEQNEQQDHAAGQEPGHCGVPILEIAQQMVVHTPDITRLIDRLEAAGLVSRQRCDNDRRVVYARITAAASDLLAQLDQPVLDLHKKHLGHMNRVELTQLNQLLEKARETDMP